MHSNCEEEEEEEEEKEEDEEEEEKLGTFGRPMEWNGESLE